MPKKPRCCWRVDKKDLDCKVGIYITLIIKLFKFTFLQLLISLTPFYTHFENINNYAHMHFCCVFFFAVNGTNWWE